MAALTTTTTTTTTLPMKSTLTSLSHAPRTSKELMLYNYRMGFFNLAANFAVLHKTKHLEKSVQEGRQQVDDLTDQVKVQGQNLNELSEGFDKVTEAVDQQQVQVDQTLQRFKEQVARQNHRIQHQQKAMERLIASKFQTDVVVDSSIAAISGLLIRTPFISLPVYMCTALLPKRSQWLVSALLKMVAFFQVAISMRKIAVQKGVHNAVGTPSKYVVAAITFLRMRTHQIMAKRREKLKKVYGSNDHSKAEQKTSEVCMVNMPAVDQMESV
jgi:hypothetical protein